MTAVRPNLDEAEIDGERAVIVEEIRSYLDDPAEHAQILFQQAMFGDGALGREICGDEDGIRALPAETIRTFWRTTYRPANTVVAVVDRGNYPVVSFDGMDTWPSIVAANAAGELRFGLDAAAVRQEPGWSVLRSFKRLINDAGPRTEVDLGGRSYPLADLFTSFLAQLKSDLRHRSNTGLAPDERIEAAISVPANASSAQRFLTLDAFANAGFEVVALLNEPSAADETDLLRHQSDTTAPTIAAPSSSITRPRTG